MEKNIYRTRFRSMLMPYMEMLRHKQKDMSNEDWLYRIEQTRKSVIQNTDQYLGNDLPSREIVEQEISSLFDEFIFEGVHRTTSNTL